MQDCVFVDTCVWASFFTKNDWRAAADLGRELAAQGDKVPLTDLVLASVARRLNASVYSTDPHFDLVPDLKRYWP